MREDQKTGDVKDKGFQLCLVVESRIKGSQLYITIGAVERVARAQNVPKLFYE